MVLPWRRPEIYSASQIARFRIAGLPLIIVAAAAFVVSPVRVRAWGLMGGVSVTDDPGG